MVLLSETASATKVRLGFSEPSPDDHPPTTAPQRFDFSEDSSLWKDRNVQVIIRVRPMSSAEVSMQGYAKCVRQESCQCITWTGHPESRFTFDLVADENVSQEKLFKVAGVPMVENCVAGYNSCMFAYGQTGSGKTHTMLGDIEGGTRRHSVNCGMTPRVFEFLFSRIQKEKEARKDEKLRFTCKCSFLEIYNELIFDLLDPSSSNLQIREDSKKGVYVENLKEIEVTSAREVILQILQGAANRKVAATNMNHASSRSHSVFTCAIESKWESQGVTHHRFSRLNLVDLAGSERQKTSGAEGDRLKEATNINKSLSTLGLVIMNLVSISNGKTNHVPYRDSKLTFLLQDSLGGNSKTTIIANISPSNSCSLETLSTLKFAQRAKFIRNNAIINEDTSGDVTTMRLEIQQLKREITRLQGLSNERASNFLGSPGLFELNAVQESFSPLASGQYNKRENEAALVCAIRNVKDKERALQALASENQAALQLAKQREGEIKGLKMQLKFRESSIKRLEAVASGKISVDSHLLKEKEELLKEIEVLRAQVDRNQEVTRFAMENLRLKEEIKRLRSFSEEGEREMMNEQISALQTKLLEALDWKLMHETDKKNIQESTKALDFHGDSGLLSTEPGSPWLSSANAENEFLHLQAIQNQAEMAALHKKLEICLEEKATLERHVNSLVKDLECKKSSRATGNNMTFELPVTSTSHSTVHSDDQLELKTMVDAIAAVSQREAEAHERAVVLSKENDVLRLKIKELIEDNNKLLELYDQATAEKGETELADDAAEERSRLSGCRNPTDQEIEMKQAIENLEHQLNEMHEENEKLMNLYEKAMQERDDFKRICDDARFAQEMNTESDHQEKLVEVDTGESNELQICADGSGAVLVNAEKNSVIHAEFSMQETSLLMKRYLSDGVCMLHKGSSFSKKSDHQADGDCCMDIDDCQTSDYRRLCLIDAASLNLERAQEMLEVSAAHSNVYHALQKAVTEVDELTSELLEMEDKVQVVQRDLEYSKKLSLEAQERVSLDESKFSALQYSLSSFALSMTYFEQREAHARTRLSVSSSCLEQKREALARVAAHKEEIELVLVKNQRAEDSLRDELATLKLKYGEEQRKRESEGILFPIENVQEVNHDRGINMHLSGKATELLKSEEERPKLLTGISQCRERIGSLTKESAVLTEKLTVVNEEMKSIEMDVKNALTKVEETEAALRAVIQEKDAVLQAIEKGRDEIENMIVCYYERVLEKHLKEEEAMLFAEDLRRSTERLSELRKIRNDASLKKLRMIQEMNRDCRPGPWEELTSVVKLIREAKSLLRQDS
ncbi:hypothetical protein MLD38_003444 [Melastoma candidum]|uniref:Uncharacterized protein n=1 Tax=Melastoma candidum TaxID=119954 RepID=A0ACB9S5S1_9MYRT|nr:hypothetical protein MLD38_003444 [Melastoma candidum]